MLELSRDACAVGKRKAEKDRSYYMDDKGVKV
jgi:hypothetical protein